MRRFLRLIAVLALAMAAGAPVRGESAYCLQLVVQYRMFETVGILIQSDYGTTVLAEVSAPSPGGAAVLMGRDCPDLWVVAGDQVHHIQGSGQLQSARVDGLMGLRPATGFPGTMKAGGLYGVLAVTPLNAVDDTDPRTKIVRYDAARGSMHTLVEGARHPVLAPDEKRMAYEKLTGKPGVYVAPLDGGKPAAVGGASTVWGWFHDELLVGWKTPGLPVLNRVQPDTGATRPIRLPPGCRPMGPVLGPAGDKILYMQDNVLYELEFGSDEPFPLFVPDAGCSILGYRWVSASSVAF